MSSAPFLPRGAASSSSPSTSTVLTIGLTLLALWLAVITGVFVTWNNDNTKAVTTGPGLTTARSGNDVVVSDNFNTRMYTLPSSTFTGSVAGSPCGVGFMAMNPYVNGIWNYANTFFTSTVGGGFNGTQWIPQYTGIYSGTLSCAWYGTTFSGTDHFSTLYVLTLNSTSPDGYADGTRILTDGFIHYFPLDLPEGHSYSVPFIFHVCPTCQFRVNQPFAVHLFPRQPIVASSIICRFTVCQSD